MCQTMKWLLAFCMLLTSCSVDREPPATSIKVGKEKKVDGVSDQKLKNIVLKKAEHEILLLLPMSGDNAELGHGILNAIMMSAYECSHEGIDFFVVDTSDASNSKHRLYKTFKNRNVKAIIGPVFFKEARQFGVLFPKIPIFTLSNNLRANNNHVFVSGLSPRDEIRTLFSFIKSKNTDGVLVLLPNGTMGDQILSDIRHEMKFRKLEEGDDVEILRYASISKRKATKIALASEKRAVFAIEPILEMSELGGRHILTLSSSVFADENAWSGAIFAFADDRLSSEFIDSYRKIFGRPPITVDMVAYDISNAIMKAIFDVKTDEFSEYSSSVPDDQKKSIFENSYVGCLGNFSIRKNHGVIRKLSIRQVKGRIGDTVSAEE